MAATRLLDDSSLVARASGVPATRGRERAPPCGSARDGAAATNGRGDGERAPHGSSAGAGAVTTLGREDPKLTFATKTDDDTERQLVHTLAHAIVFIVSSCCSSKFGAVYICPFLLEQRGSPKPGRPKL